MKFETVFGVLAAIGLAACATVPRASNPPPIEQALAESANQGNPMAQFSIGVRMLARARTTSEQTAAIASIQRAADANLAIAQARLGSMYLYGNRVRQDTAEALKWLRSAAERGAPAAQLRLGELYAVGAVVPVDKAQAYYWYSIAARPVRSDVTIFNIAQVRTVARTRAQALAESLTPQNVESVDRQVAAWVPTASVPYSAWVQLDEFRR